MTAGQISKLHNLCLQINLLAAKCDDAPVVIYTMVGDNKFAPVICISVYEGKPLKKLCRCVFRLIKQSIRNTDYN